VTEAFDKAQRMAALVGKNALQSQRDIDRMHGRSIDINYYTTGAGRSGLGFAGSGPGGHGGPGGSPSAGTAVVVHVHGSVSTAQGIVREIQEGLQRKTRRNGSTMLYIPGRQH
jgi:hypothetical protein